MEYDLSIARLVRCHSFLIKTESVLRIIDQLQEKLMTLCECALRPNDFNYRMNAGLRIVREIHQVDVGVVTQDCMWMVILSVINVVY